MWTGKFDLNRDTFGRGNFNFQLRKENFADSKNIQIRLDGAL